METEKSVEKLYNLAKNRAISIFGDRLISVYLIGSLSHGGFSEVSSDIDVAFILNGDVSENDWILFADIDEYIKKSKVRFSDRLSIFWSTLNVLSNNTTSGAFPSPNKSDGLFPPFDILDLVQNGILIYGRDIKRYILVPKENTLFIAGVEFLLSYVNSTERNKYITDLDALLRIDSSKISKTILFPVRLIFTLMTGRIGNNDDAALYFLNNSDSNQHLRDIVEQALSIRANGKYDSITLKRAFPALKELYINLIDLNKKKMADLKKEEYALALGQWRKEIDK